MRRWAGAVVVAALGIVALAGCTHVVGTSDIGTSTPRFHLAQVGSDRFDRPVLITVARTTTSPENGTEWTVTAVDPSSPDVHISWVDGGSPECGQVDRVQLQETAKSVVIGLAATHRGDLDCTLEGYPRGMTVHLRHPLGTRALMEGASGVNDGLPKTLDPATLPVPTCTDNGVADVPVGMIDVGKRMAPTTATKAFVCRTWWPKGVAHVESTTVSRPGEVASLVASLNAGATDITAAGGAPVPCPTRLRGSWYDVYLEGPGVQVEVRTDEINCMTITNGAISGRLSPTLATTLDALFSS